MLKINCPDGELKYPKSVLRGSPYIKNSLLEKHFFGQFSQANDIFVRSPLVMLCITTDRIFY